MLKNKCLYACHVRLAEEVNVIVIQQKVNVQIISYSYTVWKRKYLDLNIVLK